MIQKGHSVYSPEKGLEGYEPVRKETTALILGKMTVVRLRRKNGKT